MEVAGQINPESQMPAVLCLVELLADLSEPAICASSCPRRLAGKVRRQSLRGGRFEVVLFVSSSNSARGRSYCYSNCSFQIPI